MKRTPQQLTLALLHILGLLTTLTLAALALVSLLTILQGHRDETQRVAAIVVISAAAAPQAHLDYALELYKRGYASHLLLAGSQLAELRTALLRRGVPEAALFLTEETSERRLQMRSIASLARAQGFTSILVVNDPDQLLLDLKMASDLGLRAYGAPDPNIPLEAGRVLQSSLDYWRYVLFGSF